MAWTKLLPAIGSGKASDLRNRLQYCQLSLDNPVGSCCGAAVLYNFPSGPLLSYQEGDRSKEARKYLMDWALDSVPRGVIPLDPDDLIEEEYDEDLDEWVAGECDDETVPVTPAIVMAFLAGSQVNEWHDLLIEAGFRCMAYGQLNPKSDPNPIATYMTTFESSDVITNGGLYPSIEGQSRMAASLDMPDDVISSFEYFSPA